MTEFTFLLVGLACGSALAYVVVMRRRTMPSASPRSEPVRVEAQGDDLVREVLGRLSEGVLVFNELLRPIFANAAARRLLRLGDTDSVPVEILSIARRAAAGPEAVEEVVDVRIDDRASLRVRAVPLEQHGGVIVTLEDVTGEQRIQLMRRQFVTHASHELKSPAASIQVLAEAIDDAAGADPERVGPFAARLRGESERLVRLVDDLLDLSRVEDPASFSATPSDLGEITLSEVELALASAEAKDVRLTTSIESQVLVRGDERQLSLLVRNLVNNAIRYTPAQGSVRVEVQRGLGEGVLSVADTGIGIPLRSQARVFERFYRVDQARSREHGGTGLGLAIVKHVADLHGGRVEVDSVYGEGSTFTARLPLAGAPMARAAG